MTKRLLIKLGSKCNLDCSYCHCAKLDFSFNKDILGYIKGENFQKIVFSGGEPLMYFDVIKKIIEYLNNDNIEYSFVTNGFFFTEDVVNFCNTHNVGVALSYDGRMMDTGRSGYPANLDFIGKLNRFRGISSVVYKNNIDLAQLANEINLLCGKYGKQTKSVPNFIHQTKENPNLDMASPETAKLFVEQIGTYMEIDIMRLSKNLDVINTSIMFNYIPFLFNNNQNPKFTKGFNCCNEYKTMLAVDGRFLSCPYSTNFVGDIYTGIDWNKVESMIPEKCKCCELWDMCGNKCVANITDNECFIFKSAYNHLQRCLQKYNMTENELYEKIERIQEKYSNRQQIKQEDEESGNESNICV